ncbi:NO-inducible flavohemoprotein [Acetobacter orleanensis]|uniref:Flavohemoprotein n=1 Tax=Acetobacter orleanensis TaxID=104099 RepID=A0A4Y3TMM8_9PROT|nr:NO-inducible flavohemoprotein [Acetobacter orleanensis]KXV63921.1 dihydropteridine reductase [Acetobacter orleanensis]PCD79692.1 NO-inducible flavohemoprotein [Acetobacter orleanensis]GAN69254.1 flavohemoprotein [Acetobacter orleanensis JCM 7639]GBR28189.1 flavohemoprotein [Acetobacter orleanensis NRIC 0473]GEB82220.1 flavohemoprotein [Acetobacter orleanensis]
MTASLDDKTRAIVTACVPALEAHGLDITTEMYKRLLADPAISALFNSAHQKNGSQPTALALAVLAYARNINSLDKLGDMVERIAEKHVGLNILPEHYPHVGTALLGAIAHVLGDAATPEIMDAWAKAYGFLADVLINRESQIYKAHEAAPGGWAGWRSFTIQNRTQESALVTSFELMPTDGKPVMAHTPGQYLSFSLDVPGHGNQRRNYSISSAPNGHSYRISVRRADNGLVSGWLHDSAQVGTELQVSAPAGSFTLPSPQTEPVVLLSAGVGVTPFIAMLESRAARLAAAAQGCPAGAQGPVHFIHGTDTPQTEAFGALVRSLSAKNVANADIFYTHTPADALASQTTSGTTAHAGRITPQWVKNNSPADAFYYICGPEAFMQDMIAGLHAAGVPEDRLRHEVFGPATTLDDALNAA